jgi:membrane associated rhomboid family serine protease
MTSSSRRARSLAILASTGIRRSNYEPPYLRVLWRLGFDTPPPHFVRFLPMFSFAAAWFGVGYGATMWALFWQKRGISGNVAIVGSCLAGLFFGFAMASYYARGRRRHQLPDWESL